MHLEELFFIAQIIAAGAVVATLLYLGNQIKQSRIQAENDAMDTLVTGRIDFLRVMSEDSEMSYIIPKGLSSKAKLTPNELFRFHNYLYVVFVGCEIAFVKWKRNDISDEVWKPLDEAMHWWLSFPSVKYWWKHNIIGGFSAELKQYVNSIIETAGNDTSEAFEKQLLFMEAAGQKPLPASGMKQKGA